MFLSLSQESLTLGALGPLNQPCLRDHLIKPRHWFRLLPRVEKLQGRRWLLLVPNNGVDVPGSEIELFYKVIFTVNLEPVVDELLG